MITKIVSVRTGDPFDYYCGRWMKGQMWGYKNKTHYGNPFRVTKNTPLGNTLTDYLGYLLSNEDLVIRARGELYGVCACWCVKAGGVSPDDNLECHLQVLARAIRGDYDGWYNIT